MTLFWLGALLALVLAAAAFVRWVRSWGATAAEVAGALPGDELVPQAQMNATQAITIDAPRGAVWPWLVQIGQGRGGFYSYAWLENLFGMDIHNVDHIIPELQQLALGDVVPFWRGVGVSVMAIEPPRLLLLGGSMRPSAVETGGTWLFLLEEPAPGQTRLVVRMRAMLMPQAWLAALMRIPSETASAIMQRRMLLGIRQRVLRSLQPAARAPGAPRSTDG